MQYEVIRHSSSNSNAPDWMTNKEPKYFGINLYSTRPTGIDITFAANVLTGPKITLGYLANDLIRPDGKVNTIQKLKEQIKKDFYSERYKRAAKYPLDSVDRNIWEHAELKDSTAATAAAKVWPYVTDVMQKEKHFGRHTNADHANSAGKHGKTESGKREGSFMRRNWQVVKHSYDVIRDENHLEHRRWNQHNVWPMHNTTTHQQHSGYYSPNLNQKVTYSVGHMDYSNMPTIRFAFIPDTKKGNDEFFHLTFTADGRMVSDKATIERVILNRFNNTLGPEPAKYGVLDKTSLAKAVNDIQKFLIDYAKKHPEFKVEAHNNHAGYYSPNLRHSYDVIRDGEEL